LCLHVLNFWNLKGQATEQLKPFQEVIGIDPSSVMLDNARASIARSLKASTTTETKFQFIQGSAEDLSQTTTLQPESVDLITAGTVL
jgi:trans-aconitate 3-methyltransferase